MPSGKRRYAQMSDSYEPRDFVIGNRDVRGGWIVVVVLNIGLVILSL